MKRNFDKELKSVISFLHELANMGTLEQGQKESVTKEINNLRRAVRRHEPAKIQEAVGRVARIFLSVNGR